MSINEEKCEIIIIGGGVIGLAIGAELSRQGKEIIVLESENKTMQQLKNRVQKSLMKLGLENGWVGYSFRLFSEPKTIPHPRGRQWPGQPKLDAEGFRLGLLGRSPALRCMFLPVLCSQPPPARAGRNTG